MSVSKLRAPAVAVPTLRASTAVIGTGLFSLQKGAGALGTTTAVHHPEAALQPLWLHDEGNTVFIDELVSGVQEQQQVVAKQRPAVPFTTTTISSGCSHDYQHGVSSVGAKATQAVVPVGLRPIATATSPSLSNKGEQQRRSRSPRPATAGAGAVQQQSERKPWGFNNNQPLTPRGRPQSPHPQTEPRRETHYPPALGPDRSPAAAEKPQKRSLSANTKPVTAPTVQHVSPPMDRSSRNIKGGGQSTSPKALGLSAELLSSLNFHVKALDERTTAAEARAAAAEDRQRVMEKELVAVTARHAADTAATREKMLQLTAQLQYAMHWINTFDAMAARQNDEAFLDDNASGRGISGMHSGGAGEIMLGGGGGLSGGRAGGASVSVIRRLDLSTESATFRMPPSPPMTLEQK